MTATNRARLVVNVRGPWHLYAREQVGWTVLGTVRRGLEIGVLAAKDETGLLCWINGSTVLPLNQRKAQAALYARQAAS